MITAKEFADWPEVRCADGQYRIGRPLPTFLSTRIRDAWEVLCGRAEAVKTYDGSEIED